MTAVPPREDLILANAEIHRLPGDPAPASSLAIHDGAVVSIGSIDDTRTAAPDARVIDLAGRTVLPSFIDSHTHFHRAAILAELHLDFETIAPTSIQDVLDAVHQRVALTAAGGWIEGDSICAGRLVEKRLPDRNELDAVAGDHPVLIRGIGKHVVAANSAALALAGIDRDTPDPPGGRIERDAAAEPTGVLHERAKLRLDTSAPDTVVPRVDPARRRAAVKLGTRKLHSMGITTIHEMVRLPEEAGDLAALHATRELDLRVRLYYRVHETPISLDWLIGLGLQRGWGDEWLRLNGVKISIDGWCIFGNAAVHQPYEGEHGGTGLLRIEPAQLNDLVARADAAGLAVAVHAVGARAVDAALDAFEAVAPALSGPHRIEHAHLDVDEARLKRMARLGLVLSAQPGFLDAYADDWATLLAPDRVERIMPLATASGLGIPIIVNSDMPSGPAGPLHTIRAASNRSFGSNASAHAQDLSIRDAWRAHTNVPAEVTADGAVGRLDPGRRADIVIVDGRPFENGGAVPDEVGATLLDGGVVFDPEGWLA